MLKFIAGLPGSGKSYYAVNYLSKFGKYDKLYQTFVIEKPLLIFTNIDKFKLAHKTLESCYAKYGGPDGFFTCTNFAKIRESYPEHQIVVIIDEAQEIFPAGYRNNDVLFFFEYHRHYGIDLFLLSNNIPNFCKPILNLCETITEAQPRSKSLPGVFRYKILDRAGNFLFSQTVKQKQEVFSIYRSFVADEKEKPKNVILHWGVIFAVMLVISVFSFKAFANHMKNRGQKAIINPKPQTAQAAKPVQPQISSPRPVRAVANNLPSPFVPLPALLNADKTGDVTPEWRRYPVEAFLELDGKRWFMIYGHQVESRQCKLFDKQSMTISYYGLPLSPPVHPVGPGPGLMPDLKVPVPSSPVADVKDSKHIDGPLFSKDSVNPQPYKPLYRGI